MADQTTAEFLHSRLTEAEWPDLELSSDQKELLCPAGKILGKDGKNYRLGFWRFSPDTNEYIQRDRYAWFIFPQSLDISKLLYFRRSGIYQLSRERQLKRILNPMEKEVKAIKLVPTKNFKRLIKQNLTISVDTFLSITRESDKIANKARSYGTSAENYLLGQAATKYSKVSKQKTTYVETGEFSFLVDRLNLPTKRSKRDFAKYLNEGDISSLEILLDKLLKHEVLSEEFLRRLNDYFIKEHLRDVIALGKKILTIGQYELKSATAKEVVSRLEAGNVGQLETLWQRYFEKYLLYLIFSYKQIFPKVKLEDVKGTKKYPDFIGINHYNGLDVIEIKTHLTKILQWDSSHKNFYFSSEMSRAIIQTSNYLDSVIRERFKHDADRQKITTFVDEENLYHPRGIIIISSRKNLTTKRGQDTELDRDFTKLRNGLQNIQILTFDEVLDIPDEYIRHIADNLSD